MNMCAHFRGMLCEHTHDKTPVCMQSLFAGAIRIDGNHMQMHIISALTLRSLAVGHGKRAVKGEKATDF